MTPFTDDPSDQMRALGEVALIRRIAQWLEAVCPPPPFGIGDDCAVMDSADVGTMLTTVDALVWNEHFDDTFSAEEAGAKLVKRNLSDIAAMGGAPAGALVALTLADNVSASWLEGFHRGMSEAAQRWGMLIVGGDVTRGGAQDFFAAHLTLFGSAGRAVRRSGAAIGDWLMVTGELGGTRHGKEKTFVPRLEEGQWLAGQNVVKAMIDVTDGLAKDLPAILPASARALLDLPTLPISEAARQLASTTGRRAESHALTDGEDYELLFALSGDIEPERLIEEWHRTFGPDLPLTCLGRIAEASPETAGRLCDAATGEIIDTGRAFEHFGV